MEHNACATFCMRTEPGEVRRGPKFVVLKKDPHAKVAPLRNEEGVKFSVFLVCIHSVEITEI